MKFIIRGNKIKVTEAIKSYIESKIGRVDKYFDHEVETTVVIRTRGIDQIVEITIPTKRVTLRCEEANKDLYAAIDIASDKLERQIRKNKTRLKNKKIENVFVDFEVNDEEITDEKIVKRKKIDNKPMSEEEAILQMELLGHEFFIFQNTDTDNISVVYKRKDGNFGIIEVE